MQVSCLETSTTGSLIATNVGYVAPRVVVATTLDFAGPSMNFFPMVPLLNSCQIRFSATNPTKVSCDPLHRLSAYG
jgi:hypothetical protein